MCRVIVPNTYVKKVQAPLIFLAGPVKNAPNWRDVAIKFILSQDQEVVVADPRKKVSRISKQHLLDGEDGFFPIQRAWERHYLDVASRTGAILFWLPKAKTHDCRKAYGANTRLELGECITNYRHDRSVRFCLGSDGSFEGLDRISYDLSLDAPDKIILGSLEDTCLEALRLALKKRKLRSR